jgi:hypothetical protein
MERIIEKLEKNFLSKQTLTRSEMRNFIFQHVPEGETSANCSYPKRQPVIKPAAYTIKVCEKQQQLCTHVVEISISLGYVNVHIYVEPIYDLATDLYIFWGLLFMERLG